MIKYRFVKLLQSGQKYIVCLVIITFIFGSCIRSFIAPDSISQNLLVVEGFIDVGNDSTYVTLSRSNALSDSQIVKYESGASVLIEGNNNTSFPLTEGSPGKYSCAPFGAVSTAGIACISSLRPEVNIFPMMSRHYLLPPLIAFHGPTPRAVLRFMLTHMEIIIPDSVLPLDIQ